LADFFSDFLGKNRFLQKIAISRDFGDLSVIFTTLVKTTLISLRADFSICIIYLGFDQSSKGDLVIYNARHDQSTKGD
jgi:hypothetical protein